VVGVGCDWRISCMMHWWDIRLFCRTWFFYRALLQKRPMCDALMHLVYNTYVWDTDFVWSSLMYSTVYIYSHKLIRMYSNSDVFYCLVSYTYIDTYIYTHEVQTLSDVVSSILLYGIVYIYSHKLVRIHSTVWYRICIFPRTTVWYHIYIFPQTKSDVFYCMVSYMYIPTNYWIVSYIYIYIPTN